MLTRCNVETKSVDVNRPNRIVVTAIERPVDAVADVPSSQGRILAARDQVFGSGDEREAVNGSAVTPEYTPATLEVSFVAGQRRREMSV